MKIVMVLTSHDQLGNTGRKTGFWLEEFAAPLLCFERHLPSLTARHLGHPFQWKKTLPWHLGPAAKVRILKNLPPLRHDRGLQNHV
jgi:hypothetical protein